MKKYFLLFFVLVLLTSCEQEITLELPVQEAKLVVEGNIEPNSPPFVLLTKSQGYFEEINQTSFENSFVHGAIVKVSDGTNEIQLSEICTNNLPDSLLPYIAQYLGVDASSLASINYCFYTSFNPAIFGVLGKIYNLSVISENKTYTATTQILQPIALDSLWFELDKGQTSLGYIWAKMSDPAGLGDNYRWFAQRKGKDETYYAPFGSSFEDKFIDGKTFNFGYNRGSAPNSSKPEDNNSERGYFKTGDTVIVKFCTINRAAFEFFRTYETEVGNNGNPFASPTTIVTNIEGGGLGIWCGYAPAYDTIVAQ